MQCGYEPSEYKAAGLAASVLRQHLGLSAKELREGGYPLADIKTAGFLPWELKGLK